MVSKYVSTPSERFSEVQRSLLDTSVLLQRIRGAATPQKAKDACFELKRNTFAKLSTLLKEGELDWIIPQIYHVSFTAICPPNFFLAINKYLYVYNV